MSTTPPPVPPATVLPSQLPSSVSNDPTHIQLPGYLFTNTRTPDPGWFSQPVATILAACIAVAAALIALAGVWWQINASARNTRRLLVANAASVRKQLRAQEALSERSREYEWKRLQREERLSLAQDALEVTESLYLLAREVHPTGKRTDDRGVTETRSPIQLEYMRHSSGARLVALRLSVYGMPEIGKELLGFTSAINSLVFALAEELPLDDYGTMRHHIYEAIQASVHSIVPPGSRP